MIRLTERDLKIFREVYRWRVCLGKHIKELTGFTGQRACDMRLKKLIEAEYLERKHVLYGVPSLYFLTSKSKALIHVSAKPEKFKVEQIVHDIAVLDTAIYLMKNFSLPIENITTEKELHIKDGFGNRIHRPDFIFTSKEGICCVEIELSQKARNRFEEIIKSNYHEYYKQFWVVPSASHKIATILKENENKYYNIAVMEIGAIQGSSLID